MSVATVTNIRYGLLVRRKINLRHSAYFVSKVMKKGLPSTHRLLPAMVVHKDGMADHDVAEASDGDRDETVP